MFYPFTTFHLAFTVVDIFWSLQVIPPFPAFHQRDLFDAFVGPEGEVPVPRQFIPGINLLTTTILIHALVAMQLLFKLNPP
jgi:hypothetical protein